jgi:hypothetical protein
MNQSGIYTQADLQPFVQRLQVLKQIIKKDKEEGRHPPAIVKLMMRKLEDVGKNSASNVNSKPKLITWILLRTPAADTAQVSFRALGRASSSPSTTGLDPTTARRHCCQTQAREKRCQAIGRRTQKNRLLEGRRKVLGSWRQLCASRASDPCRLVGAVFRDLPGYSCPRGRGEGGGAFASYLGATYRDASSAGEIA